MLEKPSRHPEDCLAGGGEMGALMRATDWSATSLGPVRTWPQNLRTAVNLLLESDFPTYIAWGREAVQLYNDGYRSILGSTKHPSALGGSAYVTFAESWHILGPIFEEVYQDFTVCWDDRMLPLNRHGYMEECYFTFSYSPIRDESGVVGGIYITGTETTERVLSQRRLNLLRDLASWTTALETEEQAWRHSIEPLVTNAADLPFAMLYRIDEDRQTSYLRSVAGSQAGEWPVTWKLGSVDPRLRPLAQVASSGISHHIPDVLDQMGPQPGEAWPEIPRGALVLPIRRPGTRLPFGLLVAGLNPRLNLTEDYRSFVALVANQLSWVLTQTRATEDQRRLAELRAEREHRQMLERQMRAELYELFDQAPYPICVLRGEEMRFEMANPLYEKVIARSNIVGRTLLEVMPELRGQGFDVLLQRVLRTGEPFVGREMPLRLDLQGNGQLVDTYFTFTYSPLQNREGVTERVLVFCNEVTEEVTIKQALERANRIKDEFLAMLGHELRNPLSPILTALHLMKIRGIDTFQKERAIVERQVKHLVRLVDDLLDVSRIARGKIELRKKIQELEPILAKALEMTSPLLEAQHHQLIVEVPRDGLWIDADEARLAQVFANLLTNAAKYTPAQGQITITAQIEQAWIVVRILDDGIGIHPDLQSTIFEMFAQGSQDLDRSQGGLGLGLAIVKSLTTLHGGTISVYSGGQDLGSEFTLRLPLAESPAKAATASTALPAPDHQPVRRVLVVDDNRDAAELLAETLRASGHEVQVAFDGPAALEITTRFEPEIVLLDIGLPVMDGYEVARRLLERFEGRPMKLVALTGYGQESDLQRSVEAGFHDHLVKPVDLPRLYAILRDVYTWWSV